MERNFEESKQELGLDHFAMRTYTGLQRHLAISMVSLLFLVRVTLGLRAATQDHWTVPQTRQVVNTLVDQELSPQERQRRLDRDLSKAAYWQKRSKTAEVSHRKRRLRDLAKAGVDLARARRCPVWLDST